MRWLIVAAVVLVCGAAKAAEIITEKSRCSEFAAVSNIYEKSRSSAASAQLQEYYLYIGHVMDGLDIDHVRRGDASLIATLSDSRDRDGLVAIAAVTCRTHTEMTIWNAAASVYREIREMEIQSGAGVRPWLRPMSAPRRGRLAPGGGAVRTAPSQ
jgi:hypothetical protein